MVKKPQQGDILLLNTAPRSGHEQTGRRPYIVLSHNLIADYSQVVIVAPISSTSRDYPLYVAIPADSGLKTTGKVLLDQLTTIDYQARECRHLETAPEDFLTELLTRARTVFQKADR